MKDKTILVIGAGIAGLTAARVLSAKYKVVILEAASRAGGRIYSSAESSFGGVVEYGPEFIHGDAEETMRLLKEAGIAYKNIRGAMYRKEDGVLKKADYIVEHWDTLMHKMAMVKDETTLADFLQQHFPGEAYHDLRTQAKRYATGFDLADVQRVTVKSLYDEWANEDERQYRLPAGYGSLVDFMATECRKNGCDIHMNTKAQEVIWQKDEVQVVCDNGKTYTGNKLIVTASLGVMQSAAIHFTPAMEKQMAAFKNIGWGKVIKIMLSFETSFWKDDMLFVFGKGTFPTWWSTLPEQRPMLTGWCSGDEVKALSSKTSEEILDIALHSLGSIFDKPATELKQNLRDSKIANWQKNEWVQGGYSYSIPGTAQSRMLLNTPVENTVYFAGEALYDGLHPGTVEAAITSGIFTANKIMTE